MSLFRKSQTLEDVTHAALAKATDEALKRERAAADAPQADKAPTLVDVLDITGLPALAGYFLEAYYPEQYRQWPWKTQGVTLDLAKACAWAEDVERHRVVLRKVYRLPDGSLVAVPKLSRLTEVV